MTEDFKKGKRKERPDSLRIKLNVDLSKGVKKLAKIVQKMDKGDADKYIEIGEKKLGPHTKAKYAIGVSFLDKEKKKDKKGST